ncbi:MAG: hypothetical protein ABSD03_02355 [Vulcanimicrobiaceae bacterium]|jgi:hypothetical protein
MFASILRGLRRFFGLEVPVASGATAASPTAPHAWWIPKDREALLAAQLEKRRQALIERLANAPHPESDGADPADARAEHPGVEPAASEPEALEPELTTHGVIDPEALEAMNAAANHQPVDLNLEEFATLDEVASILDDVRRVRDEAERRIAAIELPQALMMDDGEYVVAKDWMLDHRTIHPLPNAEIYGQYWVRFARSSAGDTVTIGCSTCGKSKILTELSSLADAV